MNRLSFVKWRPLTTALLLGGIAVVLVALVVSYVLQNFKPTVEARINAAVYHLWLADDEAELQQGLSGVESLPPNGGLLMKFDHDSQWGIWMKDMLIPLDIVWLDKDKKVIYIEKNVSPELGIDTVMTPKKPARFVVELPAGAVQSAGIKMGQQFQFTIEEGSE